MMEISRQCAGELTDLGRETAAARAELEQSVQALACGDLDRAAASIAAAGLRPLDVRDLPGLCAAALQGREAALQSGALLDAHRLEVRFGLPAVVPQRLAGCLAPCSPLAPLCREVTAVTDQIIDQLLGSAAARSDEQKVGEHKGATVVSLSRRYPDLKLEVAAELYVSAEQCADVVRKMELSDRLPVGARIRPPGLFPHNYMVVMASLPEHPLPPPLMDMLRRGGRPVVYHELIHLQQNEHRARHGGKFPQKSHAEGSVEKIRAEYLSDPDEVCAYMHESGQGAVWGGVAFGEQAAEIVAERTKLLALAGRLPAADAPAFRRDFGKVLLCAAAQTFGWNALYAERAV